MREVIVVGAGIAGLTCAWELVRAGHQVTVLEAQERVGGRLLTARSPFGDGLLAELGAVFLPDNHPLPLQYARELELPLVELTTGGLVQFPPFAQVVADTVASRGGWPSSADYADLDLLSFAQFLRDQGLGEPEVGTVGDTLLGNLGEGLHSISALAAFRQLELQKGRQVSYALRDGNDSLAVALAARLNVCRGMEVVAVEDLGPRVTVRTAKATFQAERVVLGLPSRPLSRVRLDPPLPERKQEALQRPWTPVTRVLLSVEQRFWEPGATVMLARSREPAIRWMVGPPTQAQRDVLIAYVVGRSAREAVAGGEDWIREEAARVFPHWPGARTAVTVWHSWDDDRYAGGGYSWPSPGSDAIPGILAERCGRLHFAGDHTTHAYGWLQGAMESGLRAARECL